jgi:2-oxoglutarate dehydrogenase E2 component (dihydrolipoamide succinyltransferase)
MAVEITIPEVGESITEGILAEWSRADGDYVHADEPLLVLETDKITMTQVVGTIDTEAKPAEAPAAEAKPVVPEPGLSRRSQRRSRMPVPEAAPQPPPTTATAPLNPPAGMPQAAAKLSAVAGLSPAVQRLVLEHRLDPAAIDGTGRDGRLTKADVLRHVNLSTQVSTPATAATAAAPALEELVDIPGPQPPVPLEAPGPVPLVIERETRTPMTPLRQRIAQRLVEVQQQAAILTTFNEADMSGVMALRARYKDSFKERHGIGLGFMSFFVMASIDALKTIPSVNSFIDGEQVVTNHYFDIGIAVGTDRGLVVPVVRSADQLSMAEIELQIADYAHRAQERTLELSEITGATFTISNGGIFGSMLSTPILNPPGSAILGMHAIKKRPAVVGDEIVVRPMMYLALSYDHRLIDGREAVTFLKRIVEVIENPERMLLEI